MSDYGTKYIPPAPSNNGLNVAALVLGIVSLVIPFLGLITGPLAVIFAGVVIRKHEQNGMGVAGLVTGLVAIVGYLTWLIVLFVVAGSAGMSQV